MADCWTKFKLLFYNEIILTKALNDRFIIYIELIRIISVIDLSNKILHFLNENIIIKLIFLHIQ